MRQNAFAGVSTLRISSSHAVRTVILGTVLLLNAAQARAEILHLNVSVFGMD